jgi:hypothetical protein
VAQLIKMVEGPGVGGGATAKCNHPA